MRKQLISFAQVIKFCTISSARGWKPQNPPLRTPLACNSSVPCMLVQKSSTINKSTFIFCPEELLIIGESVINFSYLEKNVFCITFYRFGSSKIVCSERLDSSFQFSWVSTLKRLFVVEIRQLSATVAKNITIWNISTESPPNALNNNLAISLHKIAISAWKPVNQTVEKVSLIG